MLALAVAFSIAACSGNNDKKNPDGETVGVIDTSIPPETTEKQDEETTKSLTIKPDTAAPKPETDETTTSENAVTEQVTTTPVTKAPETTTAKTEEQTTRAPETIVLHRHNYIVKEQVEATCSKEGKVTLYCECGDTTTNSIEKLPHQLGEATCISAPICKVCGEAEGNSLSHDIKNGVCSLCNNRVYRIGISEDVLISENGAPSVTYTEETTAGTVTTYVYCSDYTSLKIFQIVDKTVNGAYVTGKNFIFLYEPQNVTLLPTEGAKDHMQIISNQTLDVLTFTDTYGNNGICAVWAKLSSFKYGFEVLTDYSVQGKLCMHITNYYRAINGAPALEYSDKAAAASLVHSIDMAKNNYFEHNDLNGRSVGDRLRDQGLNVYCAENIQAGYFHINNHETGNIFRVAHGWYVSGSHRANMLEPSYTYIGEATAYNAASKYHYYSTQVFYK